MKPLTISRRCVYSCLSILFLAVLATSEAAVPRLINYQGRLADSDGQALPDSAYSIQFKILDDSTAGVTLWTETAAVNAVDGLFSHFLGSVTPLPPSLFVEYERLYLEVVADGMTMSPRTMLTSVPYAQLAGNLEVRDDNDTAAIKAFANDHQLSVFGSRGQEQIRLQGNDSGSISIFNPGTSDLAVELSASFDSGGQLVLNQSSGETGVILRGGVTGDEAAVLPDSAISSPEILDESGFTTDINVHTVTLVHMEMSDMVITEIEIPADGYILLEGKCYVELSGTTGPNVALVQIDETEGGSSQFPYYALAGLGGYANSAACYFPVYVTRVYYKPAGRYEFRMEGRASYAPPAEVKTWDHVLTATYYSTSYGVVSKVAVDPGNHPEAVPVSVTDPEDSTRGSTYYKMDLRYWESQSRTARKRLPDTEKKQ